MEEKQCGFLSKQGDYYMCLFEFKPIGNAKRCETCEYHTERKDKKDE